MPKHIWSVLCRKGSIDSETNLISLLDVFEKVNIAIQKKDDMPKIPEETGILLPFEVELVSFFEVIKDEKSEATTEFINPSGEIVLTQSYAIKAESGSKRMRSKLKLSNLPVKENGTYIFRVSITGGNIKKPAIVAEIPLDVEITMV